MQSHAFPDLYRSPAIMSYLMANRRVFQNELMAEQIGWEKAFKLLYFD